jgi:DNA replication and repair protein RecF
MYLSQINIYNLRNLNEIILRFSPQFNIFWGKNGSGKTSLLESIYILTCGRSFRSTHAEEYISFNASSCTIAGHIRSRIDGLFSRIGIERDRKKSLQMRINEEVCHSLAQLAKIIPVQLINTESYQLLSLPPKFRRQFLDWGMFHVEPSFFPLWVRYNRALKQRNAALKRVKIEGEAAVYVWDTELIEAGESIHHHRQTFLETFYPQFTHRLNEFLSVDTLRMDYHSGWSEKKSLEEALKGARERDLAWGYTTTGPHRADLKFFIADAAAESVLSRGQLKLFVCALFLARGEWLQEKTDRRAVFLLDDIASELDEDAIFRLLEGLKRLGGQVLLTAIEKPPVEKWFGNKEMSKVFHVEHGSVKEMGHVPRGT